LLALADQALYEAKAAGRNTYRMAGQGLAFTEDPGSPVLDRARR
jgi:hypothetical protein